jgi:hypothetical protein
MTAATHTWTTPWSRTYRRVLISGGLTYEFFPHNRSGSFEKLQIWRVLSMMRGRKPCMLPYSHAYVPLVNCKFLYGPDTEILTTRSTNGFQVMAMVLNPISDTWKLAIEDENSHPSPEEAIGAFHEISASKVLEGLCSKSTHYRSPSWPRVDVERNPRAYFSGFRAHVSNDPNCNEKKMTSETSRDKEMGSEISDHVSSAEKSFDMVITESSVNEDTVEDSEYDREVFMMPGPAVGESHDKDIGIEITEEDKDPLAQGTNDSELFTFQSMTHLAQKSKNIFSSWGNVVHPFQQPAEGGAVEVTNEQLAEAIAEPALDAADSDLSGRPSMRLVSAMKQKKFKKGKKAKKNRHSDLACEARAEEPVEITAEEPVKITAEECVEVVTEEAYAAEATVEIAAEECGEVVAEEVFAVEATTEVATEEAFAVEPPAEVAAEEVFALESPAKVAAEETFAAEPPVEPVDCIPNFDSPIDKDSLATETSKKSKKKNSMSWGWDYDISVTEQCATAWKGLASEVIPEGPAHESCADELPVSKKSKKSKGKATASSSWEFDAAVVEEYVDQPASSNSNFGVLVVEDCAYQLASPNPLCEEPVQEAVSAELQFESPIDEVSPKRMKKSKKGKKGNKKDSKLLSFICDVPGVEEPLEQHAITEVVCDDPVLEPVLEEPHREALAEVVLPVPQKPEKTKKKSTYSSLDSLEELITGPAAENVSSEAPTEGSLANDLASAAAEFTESDYRKIVNTPWAKPQEQKQYDVYLTVKWDNGIYRLLTTLSENTKAAILGEVRNYFKVKINSRRRSLPEFRIDSAASEDGPIDTVMLGDGDWSDRLKFFALRTKSGVPELTVIAS